MRQDRSYLPGYAGEGDRARRAGWWGILRYVRLTDVLKLSKTPHHHISLAAQVRAVPLPNELGRYIKAFLAALFALTQIAAAVLPGEALSDKAQDQRARTLYGEVRCVVCQNESIADSSADIAADMRRDIRAHIAQGKNDSEIREILRARYGDYVLFRPRFALSTALLWGLPLVVLIGGGSIFILMNRRKPTQGATPQTEGLSPEEQARLDALLNRDR